MKIKIINGTNLKELSLKREWKVEISSDSTVGDLLSNLNLDKLKNNNGSISTRVLIFKNKKPVKSVDERLSDGDNIKFIPTVSGG